MVVVLCRHSSGGAPPLRAARHATGLGVDGEEFGILKNRRDRHVLRDNAVAIEGRIEGERLVIITVVVATSQEVIHCRHYASDPAPLVGVAGDLITYHLLLLLHLQSLICLDPPSNAVPCGKRPRFRQVRGSHAKNRNQRKNAARYVLERF